MKNYTKKVIICYDSDEAGQKAAQRALKILEEVGLEVNVIAIPDAKDPDEYIKKHGADKFKNVINAAKTKFEYNLANILAKYDISVNQDRINALNELVKFISTIYSAAERDVYIRVVADKFGVEFKSIKSDVDRLIEKRAAEYKRNESRKVEQQTAGYSDRVNPDFIKAPAVARNEETVLGLMLMFPEHRMKVFDEGLLTEEDFFTDLSKRIFAYLREACENGDDRLVTINERFTAEEIGRISKMKIARMSLTENGTDVLLESIVNLKRSVEKKQTEGESSIDKLNALLDKKRKK